jgi:alpha-1,2-mannosyltransferase
MGTASPALSLPARIEKMICPFPGMKEARAMSVFGLIAAAVMCACSLYFGLHNDTFMGRPLGGDFVQFYAVGKVLQSQPHARIYDIAYLSQLEHQAVSTMPKTQMLIFGNAPYIAWLFLPLAKLPYFTAYCVWLVFSIGLYGAALWVLLRGRFPAQHQLTIFILALSAPVYIFETWIGGQLSVIAFASVVFFVRCLEKRRLFFSGLVLGCLVFKPSLVALPVLAMIILGAWNMLAGFAGSSLCMALLSVVTMGWETHRRWLAVLQVNSYLTKAQDSAVHWSKNVDFSSFFLVLAGEGALARVFGMAALAAGLIAFAWMCWQGRRHQDQRLLWGVTLLAAPLLSIYFPVYDSVIVIPAIVLVATCLSDDRHRLALQGWLTLLWLAPWLTQASADFVRVQIFTLVLAAFAWWVSTSTNQRSAP